MRNPNRPRLDIQGHRGARGLLPENTVASFELAAAWGMHAVELDIVLTADGHLLVSHEPYFSSHTSLTPDGDRISEEDAESHNIYEMSLEHAQRYECGAIGHDQFPSQRPRSAHKPTLAEVVRAVDAFTAHHQRAPMRYNIEVKSRAEWVGRFQPSPEELAERVYAEAERLGVLDRSTLQSFDPAVVERFRVVDRDVEVAFLVENNLSFAHNLDRLSFVPDIYAPWFPYIDASVVEAVHEAGVLLITWTVNEPDDMQRLASYGVDGLITDYPDRANALFDLPRIDALTG